MNEAEALAEHERRVVDRLDGEPLRNPFARFAPLGPGKMKLLCRGGAK